MTRHLPPNLLGLFAARKPIEYVPPVVKSKMPPYTGMAQFASLFENPKEHPAPDPLVIMNTEQRRAQRRKEKAVAEQAKIAKDLTVWDPYNNPKATDEAYKTLFVARISYNTTKQTLKKQFEEFGPVKQVRIVTDLDGKPRGYAFIEFEREEDMSEAYKHGDAKKIDNVRVLVDVERGRTVKDWKPRRFGGGLGGTRIGGDRDNIKYSGRAPPGSDRRPDSRFQDSRRDDRGHRDDRHRDDRHRDDRHRDDRHRDDRGHRDDRRDDRRRDDRGHRDDRRDDRRESRRDDRRDERRDDRGRDEKHHSSKKRSRSGSPEERSTRRRYA